MKYILVAFLLSISNYFFTQQKTESLDYIFDSEVYKGERRLSVFLPAAYFSNDSTKRFIVAYLFDAQFQPYYSLVSSMINYYDQTNEGVPMILVGVHTNNRWDEFIPASLVDTSKTMGHSEKFTEFLTKEVFPLIDAQYRTKLFKVGIGHSLGGSYVMNEITKPNSIFNAAIAASPNLTLYKEQIVNQASDFYIKHPENQNFIYTSVGTIGQMELDFNKSLLHLDSISRKKLPENMTWECAILEGQNHMTTFVPTFNSGYLSLSSKLTLNNDQLIKYADNKNIDMGNMLSDFYQKQSLFSGEKNELTVERIMEHVQTLTGYEKHERVVELCQFALLQLEKENKTIEEKKRLTEFIQNQLVRGQFFVLTNKADQLVKSGNIKKASELYLEAFSMNIIKATHHVRITAVPIFAQTGEIEAAFNQLDLLANKFLLSGNADFINDPMCNPLHNDLRWEQFMTKLEENSTLYK